MTRVSIKSTVEFIKEMQEYDNDMIIAISGARGTGKSTLMMQIVKALKEGWYDFEKYHIYDRNELKEKLETFEEKETICIDEAISSLFKREFQNKNQNYIIKMFNMYRDKRYLIFLLIPHFWDLDAAVRNSFIVKWWIHVYQRGEAIIFTHDSNPGTWDPWNRKDIYINWKLKKPYVVPNYVGNISWSKIPDDVFEEYKKVKNKKRREVAEDKPKPLTKKEVILQIKQWNPNATHKAIGDVICSPRSGVSGVLRGEG